MGLDTYASRSPGDIELTDQDRRAFEAAGVDLCGGIYSGNDGSFRGEVYWSVVLEVTGVSLTNEWLAPEIVREMAEKLNAIAPETLAETNDSLQVESHGKTNVEETASLQCFFALCANRNLGLIGWF